MADLKERALNQGVTLRYQDGKVTILVNPSVLFSAKEIAFVGSVPVATVDVADLEHDIAAEGSRFLARLKRWFRKK